MWNRLLLDYDEIVHIPMSSGLSSSCNAAKVLAEDYKDRVFVVDNKRISVTQKQSVLDAKMMAEQGIGAAEIKKRLLETMYDSSIYITLETLYYLKKGGRVTPVAATHKGDIMTDPLSLSVSCHIVPGALAIACSKKLKFFPSIQAKQAMCSSCSSAVQ